MNETFQDVSPGTREGASSPEIETKEPSIPQKPLPDRLRDDLRNIQLWIVNNQKQARYIAIGIILTLLMGIVFLLVIRTIMRKPPGWVLKQGIREIYPQEFGYYCGLFAQGTDEIVEDVDFRFRVARSLSDLISLRSMAGIEGFEKDPELRHRIQAYIREKLLKDYLLLKYPNLTPAEALAEVEREISHNEMEIDPETYCLNDARHENFHTRPSCQWDQNIFADRLYSSSYISYHVRNEITVTDEEIAREYHDTREKYRKPDMFTVDTARSAYRYVARAFEKNLEQEMDFDGAARSIGGGTVEILRDQIIPATELPERVAAKLKALVPGARTDIVKSGDWFCIYRLKNHQPVSYRPLSEVSPELWEKLFRQKRAKLLKNLTELARKNFPVAVNRKAILAM